MEESRLVEYKTNEFDNARVMMVGDISDFDKEDYDLFNEKDFKKYIDDIEHIVRNSKEYRDAIQYLRKYMNMHGSEFLENVDNSETTKIKIEIHHTPFTLYDIVLAVFNKRCKLQEDLNVFLVAKEVTMLHYFLCVGLVPLSRTEHKLVHNQALFVPIDRVLGNYEQFIDIYEKYIPEDAMERYKTYKDLTEHYNHSVNMDVLQVKPTFLKLPNTDQDTLGSYNSSEMLALSGNMQKRISNNRSSHTLNLEDNKYNNTSTLYKPFTIDPPK